MPLNDLTPVPALPEHVIWSEAASALGISEYQLHRARIEELFRAAYNKHTGIANLSCYWFMNKDDLAEAVEAKPSWAAALPVPHQKKKQKREAAEQLKKEKRNLGKSISVQIRERQRQPESVIAHLGPTNSGKTYDALQFLAREGAGVYAAPLRMLAQESYDKLVELAGVDKVGLITGEERINDTAPIICCTAEMAPMRGNTLVLDEVHWTHDLERGSAWTKLLLGSEYNHYRLVGSWDAKPLLTQFFPDAEFRYHDRRVPLEYNGVYPIMKLPPKTVVITFSRKSVLALAGIIHEKTGRSVSALYGAMPVAARREEIRRFIEGESDIMVATDCVGHGINMPCDHVVFAETEKFDGVERRPLSPWEASQIAGRAGRYLLSDKGHVGTLSGLDWTRPSETVVKAGLSPRFLIDDKPAYRKRLRARLAPQLTDFSLQHNQLLDKALLEWERVASSFAQNYGPWLSIESTAPLREAFAVIVSTLGRKIVDELDQEELWGLVHAPVDVSKDATIYTKLIRNLFQGQQIHTNHAPADRLGLAAAENAAREMAVLRWYAYRFGGGLDLKKVSAAEQEYALRVAELVQKEITSGKHGRCKSCRDHCAPWFDYCNSCFQRQQSQYWDEDDYFN